ncbi:DNA helicase [Tanacetum coccineum]
MLMMKEKKPLIDLNAKCSLEITEDVEVENITESQTLAKFDTAHIETGNMNMSEHADQKMGGDYSYVGHRPTFSKVVGSEYGLRHASAGHGSRSLFNTGRSGSLEPSFACHFLRSKLILDFENSAIRLSTVNDDDKLAPTSTTSKKENKSPTTKLLISWGRPDPVLDNLKDVSPLHHKLIKKGTIYPQTYPGRNETETLPTYFEFPASNCLSSLYTSEAQYNTIWHNKCVQYYRDVESIGTPCESSFKLTDCVNEQPQFRLAKEQVPFVKGVSSMYVDIGDWKIVLQQQRDPPNYMKELLNDHGFLDNIRAYNQMFAMTSFGAHIDESINNQRGPYVFKISGQIYHWIGAMCPSSGDAPRFLQLYIYDTEHEVANRMRHYGGVDSDGLDPQIVQSLIAFLDQHNELVQIFRTDRDKCRAESIPHFKLRLYSCVGSRQYDLPTSNTLGAIVFENGPDTAMDYDVVIEARDGFPQRISRLHQSYMSLQFPLLFVYGEPGYFPEMKQNKIDEKRLSMNAYYMYQLHEHYSLYGLLFRSGRLFQQYVVGVYCCIEQNRIDYYRTHQNDIRKDYLSGVYDAIHKGDRVGSDIGGRLILPKSFTGVPRYMYSHYLDALAICRVLGNPQFFITFTCNVKWPEIKRHMEDFPKITTADRVDVVVRVFEQKVHDFCNFLQDSNCFGDVTGYPETDPEGYKVVSEMMVHGPCGPTHKDAVCMNDGNCSKKYPKKYNNETYFDKNGHAHYRRRETAVYVTRHGAELDNSNIVL